MCRILVNEYETEGRFKQLKMRKLAQHLLCGFFAAFTFFAVPSAIAYADAFEDGVADTYAAFRTATSYLRTGNAGLASLDLAEASDEWDALSASAQTDPPAAYTRDPKFKNTLKEVSRLLSETLALAEAGESKQAYQTVLPVRDLIYDLRQRNGQRVYADCITDLNAVMDEMYIYRHDPPDFTKPDVHSHSAKVQKKYKKVLDECIGMAPASYSDNPEFVRLMESTKQSTEAMAEAISAKNTASYISILRELRSFDRIIFFRFGS